MTTRASVADVPSRGQDAGEGTGGRRAAPPMRIEWLDIAKGIGIILVVIGHAMAGMIDGGTVLPTAVRQVFYLIYSFHMFLFFMLAGALVGARVARNPDRFRRSLVTRIAYPYFLWSIIQLGVIAAAGSLVNNPISGLGSTILALPFSPMGQFWFLYSLFFMHVASTLLLPRVDGRWLLVLAIGARALGELPWTIEIVWRTLYFFLPYAIGVVFGSGIDIAGLVRRRWTAQATAGLAGAAAVLIAASFGTDLQSIPVPTVDRMGSGHLAQVAWRFDAVAGAAVATFAVIAVTRYLGPLSVPLAYVGRLSFAIFVMHVMFVAGGRIVLAKIAGLTDYAVVLPLISLLGVVGPIVAYEILKRLRVDGWLGLT